MLHRPPLCVTLLMLALGGGAVVCSGQEPSVDFNRDIRPLLSANCFECHGPDANQRQAELRLDTEEGAFAAREDYRIIAAGDAASSELYRRLTTDDAEQRMPPADSGKKLSEGEIAKIKRWIDEGAQWRGHWSFSPPLRSPAPAVPKEAARGTIDAFIQARLDAAGLAPAAESAKATLIRRATLDLTGLPATLEEVDAFIADNSPDAYERVIDRLLQSPAYGERMAATWCDLARYADTAGYQTDGDRQMHRWRDWVIDAYNRNMPFDQFTVEQLAGDLLPEPTLPQLIATGFNRNHRANSEGGIVPEEYLVEYAVDRVDTTATVWLGLTLGCARCHDHKYDPLTQRDFYSVVAYFNQVPERGRVKKYGNSPPLVYSPTEKQAQELKDLEAKLMAAGLISSALGPKVDKARLEWESSHPLSIDSTWTIRKGLAARYTFDGDLSDSAEPDLIAKAREAIEKSVSKTITGVPILDPKPKPPSTASFKNGEPSFGPGRAMHRGQAAVFDGGRYVEAASLAPFTGADKFTLAAWVRHDLEPNESGAILSLMDDDDGRDKGVSIFVTNDRLAVHIGPRWLDDALRVETEALLPKSEWRHVAITYDGSQSASGLRVYFNGDAVPLRVHLDMFTGTFVTPPLFRIGSQGIDAHFRGMLDDVVYYSRALASEEVAIIACADPLEAILATPPDQRAFDQKLFAEWYFMENAADPELRKLWRLERETRDEFHQFMATVPTTMIMRDREDVKETFILHRGEYDKPKEKVTAGTPGSLPPLPAEAPNNRLGFAQWLTSGEHPLTARVAVNRLWEMMFGAGLVRTTEDFGAQGQPPTHPELLDALAIEFVESGWDVKAMLRNMATSSAYRRSSAVSPEAKSLDPDNLLWGRASRLRLGAETIRDQALAASGQLVRTIGGPSVKPRQPEGLWEELATDPYVPDSGENLYRRGLYTFWKRTIPPPAMTTFDATSRESCTVRRSRTNTPLQALALLNDETYVEAARALADRMTALGGSPEERLQMGFRLVLARSATDRERELLVAGWERKRQHYAAHLDEAAALLKCDAQDKALAERAAYTAMASVILNLDEAITRE